MARWKHSRSSIVSPVFNTVTEGMSVMDAVSTSQDVGESPASNTVMKVLTVTVAPDGLP